MELALKAWLVDNAVTTDDKTDQILQLESAGKVDIEAIYKEMFNKTTGIQPETIMHVVQLYHRTVTDFHARGAALSPYGNGLPLNGLYREYGSLLRFSFVPGHLQRRVGSGEEFDCR